MKEQNNLSLIDYSLALYYSLETYIRRDIMFIMSQIYKKKGVKGKGTFGFTVEQPEIEAWVRQQYEVKS